MNVSLKCHYKQCLKAFKTNGELRAHLRNVHSEVLNGPTAERRTETQDFECKECNKKFGTRFLLKSHNIRIHSDLPRLYDCTQNDCKYRAKTLSNLNSHINSVHVKVRRFKCHYERCLKKFKTNRDLRQHLRFVHSDCEILRQVKCGPPVNEPPLKCPFEGCDKEFRDERLLARHNDIHLEVIISCNWPGCEYKTINGKNLKKHEWVHRSDDKRITCDWPECGRKFTQNRYLKEHMKTHTNVKPYACIWPGCQFRTNCQGNLAKHMRRHNK